MDRAEQYLELYRELEEFARNRHQINEVRELEEMTTYESMAAGLRNLREIRNFLTHRPKYNNEYIVQPSESMVGLLSSIIKKVKFPAKDIGIPFEEVLWKTVNDLVLPTMKDMHTHTFTHVPIVEDRRVIGVFSENSIFSYLVEQGIIGFETKTTFNELMDYLHISNRIGESYRFVPKDITALEVKEIFDQALQDNERIGMIFFTHNGKQSEKLLSILTAWDFAGF